MDPERKRALKKLGKAEVQRQSDEVRRALDEANPMDASSDAWIRGHKLGTERERWLRKRLPTLHQPQLDALFVVRPYVGTGWVPTPGGYVQCEDCGSALPSMRPKSWFHSTGCRCGNIEWWEILWWRRITVRGGTPQAASAVVLRYNALRASRRRRIERTMPLALHVDRLIADTHALAMRC